MPIFEYRCLECPRVVTRMRNAKDRLDPAVELCERSPSGRCSLEYRISAPWGKVANSDVGLSHRKSRRK